MTMWKARLSALLILLIACGFGYYSFYSATTFKLGLDLSGGTALLYRADTSVLKEGSVKESMAALRDVIERRINMFGVSEPVIQVTTSGSENRLLIELPGVTNVDQAVQLIGLTPVLQFKTELPLGPARDAAIAAAKKLQEDAQNGKQIDPELAQAADSFYVTTELSGQYLKQAQLSFGGQGVTSEPQVLLEFNAQGSKMFAEMTKANINKTVAIYLDGSPITTPVVKDEIKDGKAVISGSFTPQEARELVGRLNAGALPVPISLLSTQKVGASLGKEAVDNGIRAGIVGLAIIAIFMISWYRLPGLLASIALVVYTVAMLSIFKFLPVVMTAAGIAGFILSIGMAVDANILIFERMKEELRNGKAVSQAMREGFARAWLSIRDSNVSSMITAAVLFWMGTSVVRGFALTFGIGVLVSMLTAISVTRTFLLSIAFKESRVGRFLLGYGGKLASANTH